MKVKDLVAQLQQKDQESEVAIAPMLKVNHHINEVLRIQEATYRGWDEENQTPVILLVASLEILNEDENLNLK